MSERVEFATEDGIKIIGDFYSASNITARAVLLLHMMPSDRKSWATFAEKLASSGMSALAIDLRGHGESVNAKDGRVLDFMAFSDQEHQSSIEDVRASHEWLKTKGIKELYLIGASIGANLALQYAAKNSKVKSVILLSPGANYKGIEPLSFVGSLNSEQSVYIVASKDDIRSGGPTDVMAKEIFDALTSKKKLKIFETGGHGTDILSAHPDFEDVLVEFFEKAI